MISAIKHIYDNFLGSLDTNPHGFSARKLTAFMLIACVIGLHMKYVILGDFTHLEMVLTIDYGFIATLFGMTTYQNIKKDKNEKDKEVA